MDEPNGDDKVTMYFELLKLFPDDGMISCYPYTILVDMTTYEKQDVEDLEKFLDERIGGGYFISYTTYDFPTLLINAIGNDSAYVITKNSFDLKYFDEKYHNFIKTHIGDGISTLEEFKNKVINKDILCYSS